MTQKKIKKSFVLQTNENGCGPACLSSICNYYGKSVSQEQISILSGSTIYGTSLLGLYQAAKSLGFEAEGYETDIEHLKKINLPCILPVIVNKRYEHYIVCYLYDGSNFIIGNPSTGIHKISESELIRIWDSRSLLLVSTIAKENKKNNNTRKGKINWFILTLQADFPRRCGFVIRTNFI
ncbi:MAG: cysteine peptidase family C39 domain-containing protein [Paludibacteraceae bacterium]